jgi:tRNA threonylcarbamoyladenosine biosynthesis protein TsaE
VITVLSASAAETRQVGAGIASALCPGDVVLLIGSLGAGKTTLVQGLVAALGGDEEVTSPTFTLAHEYKTTPPVTHVDLWRLEHLQEVVELALDEELEDGSAVVFEWGEAAVALYGSDALVVRLGFGEGEGRREISLEAQGESWQRRTAQLSTALAACMPAGEASAS